MAYQKKSKEDELLIQVNNYKIDILGIVDHKIIHDDPKKYHEKDNSTLITTSATRSANNTPIGGIGFLLNRMSNTVTLLVLSQNIIGDFNAPLGPEDALYTFHDKTSNNGKLLLHQFVETNLIIANIDSRRNKDKPFTFMSEMSNRKSQIDYILINNKWKNCLKNCQAYSSFVSVGSDHCILSAKLRLSLWSKTATPRKENYEWNVLKSDQELQNRYSIQLHNRFSILQNELTDTYRR